MVIIPRRAPITLRGFYCLCPYDNIGFVSSCAKGCAQSGMIIYICTGMYQFISLVCTSRPGLPKYFFMIPVTHPSWSHTGRQCADIRHYVSHGAGADGGDQLSG